jgi:hypothetical protein
MNQTWKRVGEGADPFFLEFLRGREGGREEGRERERKRERESCCC